MDQLEAMRTFVKVVQLGSFSAVGRDQESSQATTSRRISALESKLGVKLLTRTSRELSLTEVGVDYYQRCMAILAEMDEADAVVRSQTASPKGTLRIAAPIAFSRLVLAPMLASFCNQFPDIEFEILASDQHVDLINKGVDVAIRAKQLEDSSLVARPLSDNPMLLVASPDYIKRYGAPKSPEQLTQYSCLVYSTREKSSVWRFECDGQDYNISVNGQMKCTNGDTLLEAALAGLGITELPIWMVRQYLSSGRLVQLLSDYKGISLPLNIIYPQNRYVPLKVRCFIDFLLNYAEENEVFKNTF